MVLLNADPAALVTAHDDALELLASLMQRPAWHADAACQDKGWKMFFLERGQNGGDARKLCATCTVRVQCADAGLADSEAQGIWGGSSHQQRRRARAEGWDAERLLVHVDESVEASLDGAKWPDATSR